MSTEHKPPRPPAAQRPVLRLVGCEADTKADAGATEATPAPRAARRSPFLDFMNAYADAVDQEVKVLLDL